MNLTTKRLSRWIIALVSGLYFGASLLRSWLFYQDDPILIRVVGLQALFLILYLSVSPLEHRLPHYFSIYLVIQTGLVFFLLASPENPDFFGVLFNLLSMQVMLRIRLGLGAVWIGICALGMVLVFQETYGMFPAVAFAVIYTAGNVFLGAYTLAIRRAQAAYQRNQSLAVELQEANQKLLDNSTQLEQLAIVRERNRLARELHDSVTQTVFSMNLVTQAAIVQQGRDLQQVAPHLERLNQLGRSALAEMQILISELDLKNVAGDNLEARLRHHLASSRLPSDLSVSLNVEGDQKLAEKEERGLFRIAEEALNNIVKHAHTSKASIHLHLVEPFWMEIQDHGLGFDLQRARTSGQVGLASMFERAQEIGWDLKIATSPGTGTRIRVEKFL